MKEQNKRYDVIVVGELNVDLILNGIDGYPEIGKEKMAEKMSLTLGSSSAIFASNLSSLGAEVAFLGKIGEDVFGELVLDSLGKKGVDTEHIIRDAGLSTGATVVLNYDEDRAMVTHAGAMERLSLSDIKPEVLSLGRHLHFSSLFLQPGIAVEIDKLFKMAKEAGLTTSLDTQWDPKERWELDFQRVLPLVDVFLPNEQELFLLTGENNLKDALNKIKGYANTVVVKQGNRGSYSWSGGEGKKMEPFLNTEVIDAIGAGDSFNAGFIYRYLQNRNIEECQRFANLIGAVNTTASGGTGAFTDRAAVEKSAEKYFKTKLNWD
jgi:sugar/nucleoside kinase (ribokinase family)